MLQDSAGSTVEACPSTTLRSSSRRGTTRSGASAVFTASGSPSEMATCSPDTSPGQARRSTSSVSSSFWSRLTANSVTAPDSSSRTAVTSRIGTSPWRDVSCVGPVASVRSTVPRPYLDVSANGWKMACRQAGPPGSDRIGAITLTSWARQPIFTRSACRSSEMSRLPTTTASVTEYRSSISRGASPHSSLSSPTNLP